METVSNIVSPTSIPAGMILEKVDIQILKVKVGERFAGVYVETSTRPWTNEDGEIKEITQLHFTDSEGKNPFVVFADSGLQNAFNTANIKVGEFIVGERLAKIDLGKGGRTVNQWALFKARPAPAAALEPKTKTKQ